MGNLLGVREDERASGEKQKSRRLAYRRGLMGALFLAQVSARCESLVQSSGLAACLVLLEVDCIWPEMTWFDASHDRPIGARVEAECLMWRKKPSVFSLKMVRLNRSQGHDPPSESISAAFPLSSLQALCMGACALTLRCVARRLRRCRNVFAVQASASSAPFSNTLSSPGAKTVQVSFVVRGAVTTTATRSVGWVCS